MRHNLDRMWLLRLGILATLLLALSIPAGGALGADREDGSAGEKIPKALKRYKGREIAQTMHYSGATWLMRDTRQQEENCQKLMEVLDFKLGQVVCDMGCGNGFYTLPIAQKVGAEGRVLAVDIQPEMLSMLNERTKQEGLENIEPILGSVIDPHLPEGALDVILLVDVYHEFSHPEHMLKALRSSLKPKGRMVLVEFRAEDKTVPIKPEHKMSKKQILKELQPNGFTLVEQFDGLPWQHVMYFERSDPDKAKRRKSPARRTDEANDDVETPQSERTSEAEDDETASEDSAAEDQADDDP